MILLQIQQENNFLPTSKHLQALVRRFLGICLYTTASFVAQINVSKRDATLSPVAKILITNIMIQLIGS